DATCWRSTLVSPSPRSIGTYTLSLHDALPISDAALHQLAQTDLELLKAQHGRLLLTYASPDPVTLLIRQGEEEVARVEIANEEIDRKSTRLNSSHVKISYAVFCLKKKNANRAR